MSLETNVVEAPALVPPGVADPPGSILRRLWGQMGLRIVPGLVFFVLSVPQFVALSTGLSRGMADGRLAAALPGLVASALYLAFVWLNVVLFVSRGPAVKRDGRAGAWCLAMLGTFGLIMAPLLPGGPAIFRLGAPGVDLRLALGIVSMVTAIATLCFLGRSFGLTPEARRLVVAGPYRLVRHPLYLCESINIVGLALVSGRVTVLITVVVVFGAQVGRAHREERLLTSAFPEYPEAMRGVPHFLPGIY